MNNTPTDNQLTREDEEIKEVTLSAENGYIKQLIDNSESIRQDRELLLAKIEEKNASKAKKEQGKNKIFVKYTIKDIVFLAIMCACMLITGGVMPLVTQVPIFGIIELVLGLQFSIFPVIGMMKVRKPGALILMSLFCGVFFLFFFPPMFVTMLVCGVIAEAVVLLIFRGYKSDWASVVAGTLYLPLSLPFLYLWFNFIFGFGGEDGAAIHAFTVTAADAGFAVGISVAVVAVCFVGSIIGMFIARELKKAGKLKK